MNDVVTTPRSVRERVAFACLLVATGVSYLINLSASGWANSFYAAAVQAGSVSWKAFLFGSSDAANSITVDKPPASLWIMSLSARIFGMNTWAMLVPQVIMAVLTVALVVVIVRRSFGPGPSLLAGLVLAVTPVFVLMFRFNNPDALLVLLMTAAVWAALRAVEDGRTRWLVLCGALCGFGFLTKQLQVLLVVPPIALMYAAFGPRRIGARFRQLAAAAVAMIVSAGWWVALVELWPASSRPWIGGSQSNSILELTFGYNGFGRLTGNEKGSVGGGGGGMPFGDMDITGYFPSGGRGGGMWGETGILRMFEPAQGGQIAWLIPTAFVVGIAALVAFGRTNRTSVPRAMIVVNAVWLLVTGLVFSFMSGIFHQYYTVAMAPSVAMLLAGGAAVVWRLRDRIPYRVVAVVAVVVTAAMAWLLLSRTPDFVPWLKYVVLVAAVVAAVACAVGARTRPIAAVAIGASLVAGLSGPVAYSIDTIATPHHGSIVTAGPAVQSGFGPGGGGRGGDGAFGGMPPGMPPGTTGAAGPGTPRGAQDGAQTTRGDYAGARGGFGGGPGGSLLEGSEPSEQLVSTLEENADDFTWMAATVGANSASGYQLATGQPVMPIGGFNGTDPSPTLETFQDLVRQGRIHWFIAGGGMGRGGGSGTSQEISEWVTSTFPSQTVDGVTLYDLTAPQ